MNGKAPDVETAKARAIKALVRQPRSPDGGVVELNHDRCGSSTGIDGRLTAGQGGCWECIDGCGLKVTAHEAGVLLSAALTASDPDCDSVDEDGIHADVLIALKGGPR